MIRLCFRVARLAAIALAVCVIGFSIMPFTGAMAQTSPRPPRVPRTAPAPLIIPGYDFDLSGLARLDELRALDLSPLSRGLDQLRRLDFSELNRGLKRLNSIDMAPLNRGLNELQAMDLSPLAELGQLRALEGLSSLQSLGRLSELSLLRSPSTWNMAWNSDWNDDRWSDTDHASLPPEAWQTKDPADSLYRLARKALSSDSYRRASELYRRIRTSYPKSAYTPDAAYWEAFSLQRLGGQQDLKTALDVLRAQLNQFPTAATVNEARSLQARLEGQLARLGDVNYVAKVQDNARSASSANCPNESEDERIDALDALIQMDAESALPMLKKVLARRDECSATLRKKAVWLVGSRKTPEAADIIINTIRNDPDRDVKETAVFWLTNAPSDRATDLLVELARSGSDTQLRQRAVYSLSQLRDPKGREALKEIVLDNSAPTDLRGDAIFALANSGRGLRGVSSGSGLTVTSLNGRVTGVTGQQMSATAGAGTGANEDLLPFLKQVYGKVEQQDLKERVLQAAMQMRSEAARDWMIEIALNPKESSDARRQAVYTAASAGATVEQLSAIYDKADDTEVRKQVLYVLTTRKDNAGVDKLIQIVRTEKDQEIRKQAIYWLGRSKDPRAIQLLQEIINK